LGGGKQGVYGLPSNWVAETRGKKKSADVVPKKENGSLYVRPALGQSPDRAHGGEDRNAVTGAGGKGKSGPSTQSRTVVDA